MENKIHQTYNAITGKRLHSCHADIQQIIAYVTDYTEVQVICGHRGKKEQEKAFERGSTKLHFPDSKHNIIPSMAIDIAPKKTLYKSREAFYFLAGIVMTVSEILYKKGMIEHHIRWGGDWDGDQDFRDQTFDDLAHFELIK